MTTAEQPVSWLRARIRQYHPAQSICTMLNERQLLDVWQRGYASSPIERVVLMSTLVQPALSIDQILDLPIGFRDARLIGLRQSLFGGQVTSTVNCTQCDAKLELSFDLSPMLELSNVYTLTPFETRWQSDTLQLRYPTTRDLLECRSNPADSSRTLLENCLVDATTPLDAELWNDQMFQQTISQSIHERDPLGLIEFGMTCSECQAQFSTVFDIGRFLWVELDTRCQRLLADIHVLARAYGWSEADVLDIGPWRRQVYLNMVRQ